MRFHLPALIGRPTKRSNSTCAYTQKIRKFAAMMEPLGHEVLIYGGGGHDGPGTYVPTYGRTDPVAFEPELWDRCNALAVEKIARRAAEGDVLGLIAGRCQQSIAQAVPELRAVEWGVGYAGIFAPFRVFESYAWMHSVYTQGSGGDAMRVDGRYFDAVIPNAFDVADFPLGPGGEYLLWVGRLEARKGIHVAAQIAAAAGMELLVAGEGSEPPSYGELLGNVGPERRAELMGGARAILCPTTYLEPFGGAAVEAMLCGTPAITTDWGAFTETVRHGVTGYRCRMLGDFTAACRAADGLDRAAIAAYARERYSLEAVAPQYDAYFRRLATLPTPGFYSPSAFGGLPVGA